MGDGCVAELIIDVDDGLLEEVKKVCEDEGLTIDDSINIFLKKVTDDGKLPDEILEELFIVIRILSILKESIKNIKKAS